MRKVEDRLFKIHRYFLQRESAFFQQLFKLPQSEGSEEGTTDGQPILLGSSMQVTLKEMEAFLNFVYYGYVHRSPAPPPPA